METKRFKGFIACVAMISMSNPWLNLLGNHLQLRWSWGIKDGIKVDLLPRVVIMERRTLSECLAVGNLGIGPQVIETHKFVNL